MGSISYPTALNIREAMDDYMNTHMPEGESVVARSFESIGDRGIREWSTAGYYAVRKDNGVVVALVALGFKHRGEVYIKMLDETMGVGACDVSPRVLAALTPLDDPRIDLPDGALERSKKFREDARQFRATRLEKQKALRNANGGTITLERPLSYQGIGEVTKVNVDANGNWSAPCGTRLGKPARPWRFVKA